MEKKFQKKKLNREDHKKMDNAAKNVKKGGVLMGAVVTGAIFLKNYGPKIISATKNLIAKS